MGGTRSLTKLRRRSRCQTLTSHMKTSRSITLSLVTSSLLLTSLSLHASETDNRIEAAAKKSHVFKTYLRDDSIRTESKNGIVVLSGTVLEESHRMLAENTVENLPGVKGVVNQLTVQGEKPAEHSDGWISTKVKTTLLFHRNVKAGATDVFVKDGIVSLRGEAISLAQKELTAEYAADVEGVKGVKNEMTIAATPAVPKATAAEKLDDASITAQVRVALMSHRSTSAVKTKIVTRDGVVTLTGIARNPAEKSLVTKLVGDINGVTRVENNMTIAVPVVSN